MARHRRGALQRYRSSDVIVKTGLQPSYPDCSRQSTTVTTVFAEFVLCRLHVALGGFDL